MRFSFLLIIIIIFFSSCARQSSPQGGPKDETPPVLLKASPDTLATNVDVNLKEIRIDFDEYIVLKDYTKQVVVSPQFKGNAIFSPMGTPKKHINIRLNAPLEPNSTYNINFGESIQDNNEGNKLTGFNYVFSTGDYIDSLEIKGKISSATDKKIPENTIVALYKIDSIYKDSIILKEKPYYLTRADAEGNYKLQYLAPGKYKLLSFSDEVPNNQYDLGQEKIGFVGEHIELTKNIEQNIRLSSQVLSYKLDKAEQRGYGHAVFKFKGNPEEISIKPINKEFETSVIYHESKSDSLNFWFNPKIDSIAEKSMRLEFQVKHKDKTDTTTFVYSNRIVHKLTFKEANAGNYSPANKFKLTANYPIQKIDSAYIEIYKSDSIVLPFKAVQDEKDKNTFVLDFKTEEASSYKIKILPEGITDFFGAKNDTLNYSFRTKGRNDIGNLYLKLENAPEKPFWIQLLNKNDKIIDEKYSTESDFSYPYLTPGEYYFKILIDENENGFWDSGDFFENKQPEPTFIYADLITVRAMWDLNETWILLAKKEIVPEENNISEEENSEEESVIVED